MNEQLREVRVVVTGDALVSASGDPKGMGWLGRVLARTPVVEPLIDVYPLAFPGDTSAKMVERYNGEVQQRMAAGIENRLVLVMSNFDPAAGISISRSRLNLATILDDAKRRGVESFVVGPTPHRNPELNGEIEHLSAGFEDVCARRGVNYVDCFTPLIGHDGWNSEIASDPAGRPGQIGHGLIAWLVLNRGWGEWLGLPDQLG